MVKRATKKTTNKKVSKPQKSVQKLSTRKVGIGNKMDVLTQKVNSLKKKRYFALVFVFLILILLVYAGRGVLFAAMVGGKPISRLTLIKELEKRGGKDALENLITKEMIAQESRKKGVSVTDAEVSAEIARIEGIVEGQGMNLETALESQGQTIADLEENIRIQKTLEKLLADKIQVTDEEIQKFFDDNKESYGVETKFEDIKDSIKDQLIQNKLSAEFETYLASIRAEKKVIYFLDFE